MTDRQRDHRMVISILTSEIAFSNVAVLPNNNKLHLITDSDRSEWSEIARATYVCHEDLVRYRRWINAELIEQLNIQTSTSKVHSSAHHTACHIHHTQSSAHNVLDTIGCRRAGSASVHVRRSFETLTVFLTLLHNQSNTCKARSKLDFIAVVSHKICLQTQLATFSRKILLNVKKSE